MVQSFLALAAAYRLLSSVVLFQVQEEGKGARCAPGAEETAQYGQGPLDLSATYDYINHMSHIALQILQILQILQSHILFLVVKESWYNHEITVSSSVSFQESNR